jgi:alpha-D-xyloside xylohydrolase
MMRALMMDFARDKQALDINDEYMFGKSLLVCPVTKPMYSKETKEDFSTLKSRELYLPKGVDWYDFWTDEKVTGGQTLSKETPIDIIPLYVKAGTILPIGPKVQYATEKNWDNLEIRVYEGAKGEFTLYEDENDNYNYEKGLYSTIGFKWNNTTRTLTLGKRQGDFPGMLKERVFQIVLLSPENRTGGAANGNAAKIVKYNGLENKVVFR